MMALRHHVLALNFKSSLPVSCGVCYKLSLLLLSKTALAVITKSCSCCGYEKAALTVIIKKLLLLRL
jgi:hypothetical protein